MSELAKNVFLDELLASMPDADFSLADFDFTLPEHFISRTPRSERSAGRLLCLDKSSGALTHSQFASFDEFINEGDLLVFNDTRIMPSKVIAKKADQTEINVYIERVLTDTLMLARIFKQPLLKVGDCISIENYELKILDINEQFYEFELVNKDLSLWKMMDLYGELAFPTYFQREATPDDKEFFQTIYAKYDGSVSAPSAGFHFDEKTFQKLQQKNVLIDYITLHVGSGTSAPIHVDDISKHKMHTEWLYVSPQLCEKIKKTKERGNRVYAIGTTSLRALETAGQSGTIKPFEGLTDIFIRPGYQFKCVDGLFTNFHLPKSTLMILISTLAGYDNIKNAYKVAIADNYRFLAYGDGMFIY